MTPCYMYWAVDIEAHWKNEALCQIPAHINSSYDEYCLLRQKWATTTRYNIQNGESPKPYNTCLFKYNNVNCCVHGKSILLMKYIWLSMLCWWDGVRNWNKPWGACQGLAGLCFWQHSPPWSGSPHVSAPTYKSNNSSIYCPIYSHYITAHWFMILLDMCLIEQQQQKLQVCENS